MAEVTKMSGKVKQEIEEINKELAGFGECLTTLKENLKYVSNDSEVKVAELKTVEATCDIIRDLKIIYNTISNLRGEIIKMERDLAI